ncbi:MAG: rRNA maturation RNase YbeY [Clostridia bacterium]|nr:rRNA maturation RNase YbeY [Clostridia bacterium]
MSFHIYGEEEELAGLNVAAIEKAVAADVDTDVGLAIEFLSVSGEEIRDLNSRTRGIDKVTDVLSYPTLDGIKGKPLKRAEHACEIDEEGRLLIGSVVVCKDKAKEQAEEYGHSYERELHYLLVHGIMHCLGYDHMTDGEKAEMREREERVLARLGIVR